MIDRDCWEANMELGRPIGGYCQYPVAADYDIEWSSGSRL